MTRLLHRATISLALSATLAASIVAPAPLAAQADTLAGAPRKLFTWNDAALLGGFVALTAIAAPLDKHVAKSLQDSSLQTNHFLGEVSDVVRQVATPGSFAIGAGLYAYGRLAHNTRAADLGLHGTEALLVGQVVGTVMKGAFGRGRPYHNIDNPSDFSFGRGFKGKSEYQSFPSGHTIAAFAAAAAVSSETSRWWPNTRWIIGPVLYGGAALAGASRMYNNKHWFSDVMMGAAVGTFAGLKVVRWQHSHPGNRLDKWLLSGSISRTPEGAAAISWTITPDLLAR